jgi:hypothetical protein
MKTKSQNYPDAYALKQGVNERAASAAVFQHAPLLKK